MRNRIRMSCAPLSCRRYRQPIKQHAIGFWPIIRLKRHPRLLTGPDCSLTLTALQQADGLAMSRLEVSKRSGPGGQVIFMSLVSPEYASRLEQMAKN